METNVGVTKVVGGTAAVLGGALSFAAFVISGPASPFALQFVVSGPAFPLAIAGTILGTAASLTSAGAELAKCSTFKARLQNLQKRYHAFLNETQQLEAVVNELLGLLEQLSQFIRQMSSSFELAQVAVCKALKLEESANEKVWLLDMENLSAGGSVILEAVGVVGTEGEDVQKMTRVGKAVSAFCKNPMEMQLPSTMLQGEELKGLNLKLDKTSMLRAGFYGMGATAASDTHRPSKEEGQAGVIVLSTGAGVWDVLEGVRSLHRGSHAAQLLRHCVEGMRATFTPLEKALDIIAMSRE